MDFELNESQNRLLSKLAYLLIAVLVLVIAVLSFQRGILNYGTETDFLGGFVPEAQRFLNGEALVIEYHPPLYSMILAIGYAIIGNWMYAGLLLSLLSALTVLFCGYQFFALMYNKVAALYALLALAVSTTFVQYSMQATSDMLFLALFFASLMFIALSLKRKKVVFWFCSGLLVGLAIITRTNGFVLIAFVLFAFVNSTENLSKKRISLFFLMGVLIPVLLWGVFALYKGSPVSPTSTYKNLAQTYFSDNVYRSSGDALQEASQGMHSSWDVVSRDPVHIAKVYVKDLFGNVRKLFSEDSLIPFPFSQLMLLGFIFLFFFRWNRFNQILLFNLLISFLLLNFKAWEDRFFIFFVPFLGVGIGSLIGYVYSEIPSKRNNRIVFWLVITAAFIFILPKFSQIYNPFSTIVARDVVAASQKLQPVSSDAVVIARKPHIGFYSHTKFEMFPNVSTLEQLREFLLEFQDYVEQKTIFLFYGYSERKLRSELEVLYPPGENPPWLETYSQGKENGGWVLYQVLKDKL